MTADFHNLDTDIAEFASTLLGRHAAAPVRRS